MRFLYTLLLSLGCFAVTLQSHSTAIPEKAAKASNEYRPFGQSGPNDALNDYYHVTPAVATANTSSPKEASAYFTGSTENNSPGFILNDCFVNTRLHSSCSHAKNFRIKLIFPQHYHW